MASQVYRTKLPAIAPITCFASARLYQRPRIISLFALLELEESVVSVRHAIRQVLAVLALDFSGPQPPYCGIRNTALILFGLFILVTKNTVNVSQQWGQHCGPLSHAET